MRRYLVVSNQTLTSSALEETIRSCLAEGPCRFRVVVPASHANHGSWTEGHDRAMAQERLAETLERLTALGATVEGEVGDVRPLYAIADAMETYGPFDRILLFTLPAGLSHWLHQDLVHRVRRRFTAPVTHVVAEPAHA